MIRSETGKGHPMGTGHRPGGAGCTCDSRDPARVVRALEDELGIDTPGVSGPEQRIRTARSS